MADQIAIAGILPSRGGDWKLATVHHVDAVLLGSSPRGEVTGNALSPWHDKDTDGDPPLAGR